MSLRLRNPRQAGFSLVELMVALVVSLILLAGILQILLGNRQSFEAQKALAGLQQDARLASFVIEHAIAHAGYRVELEPELQYIFPNGFIDGTDGGVTDGEPNPDSVRIRFQANGGVSDCIGTQVGSDEPDVADFALSLNAQNELQCTVFDDSGTAVDSWALISNVETLQIRYGLDTDESNAVDTYTSSLTAAQRPQVRSVRVQLLLASEAAVLPAPTSQTFTFADGQMMTFDDTRRTRQMVDQTIALRNLLP